MISKQVQFRVVGDPRTQGSKTGFVNKRTGKVVMRESAGMPLKNWRMDVAEASEIVLMDYRDSVPFEGPVGISIDFSVNRAKARKKWETWAFYMYDIDKLVRAVFDGIVQGKLVRDDVLFCELRTTKKLSPASVPWLGCDISIYELTYKDIED